MKKGDLMYCDGRGGPQRPLAMAGLTWLCILKKGHEGDHLSLDNTRMWKGTPGYPIRWLNEKAEATSTARKEPVTPIPSPVNRPHFTGRACDHCGSMNTIQNGKCLLCMDCKETGECG